MNNQEFKCSISENSYPTDLPQSSDIGETLTTGNRSDTIESDLRKCLRKGVFRSNPLTGIQEMKQIRSKTKEEVDFLNMMFEKDPTWNRKTVQLCKKELSLATHQIYKWGYDKKTQLKKKQLKLKRVQKFKGSKADKINMNLVHETTPVDLNEFVSDLVEHFERCLNLPQLPTLSCIRQPIEIS